MTDNCHTLHAWINSLRRFRFPFDKDLPLIPQNGIYILFEQGEAFDQMDRIVRVGTHTGNDQLQSRLYQHFVDENKDRSIFRKNIGRCFLNKESNPYLKVWELDFTTRDQRKKNAHLVDRILQQQLEKRISRYIRHKMTFSVIEVKNRTERLRLESRLVSTISLCKNCKSSANWLGQHSPKERIKESGLWQVNELYKTPLNAEDMKQLKALIGSKL
ncbi:MAG: hypothetical protein M0Z67_02165 [Nitrospiraceae bacterium]|nr:hypothetical protein [Nitrospiraceae bacterium]